MSGSFSTGGGSFTTTAENKEKSKSGLLEDYAGLMQKKGTHWSDAYQAAKLMTVEELQRAVQIMKECKQ